MDCKNKSCNDGLSTLWMGVATKDGVSATRFEYGDIGRNKVRDTTCMDALKAFTAALG